MDECIMTNAEIELWRLIGEDLGLKFDEMGHPYREGEQYELEGHPYRKLYDWRPLDDDGDAFRLQVHYGFMIEFTEHGVYIRNQGGHVIKWCQFYQLGTDGERSSTVRRAIFNAAAIQIQQRILPRRD